jgi:hypothetical protein
MKLSGSTYVSLLLAAFVLLCSRSVARPLDDVLVGSGDGDRKPTIYSPRKVESKSALRKSLRVYSVADSASQIRGPILLPKAQQAAMSPIKAPATLNKFVGGDDARRGSSQAVIASGASVDSSSR